MTHFVLARENPHAPFGYSYFTGSIEMVDTEGGAAIVPSTGWTIDDGFAFRSPRAALPIQQLFRQLCPTASDWFVVRHRVERAA
jgi:hypothetical protein